MLTISILSHVTCSPYCSHYCHPYTAVGGNISITCILLYYCCCYVLSFIFMCVYYRISPPLNASKEFMPVCMCVCVYYGEKFRCLPLRGALALFGVCSTYSSKFSPFIHFVCILSSPLEHMSDLFNWRCSKRFKYNIFR